MKERGIIFSAPMVRALLTGTKTQTRRAAKMPSDVDQVYIDPGGTIFGPGPYLKISKIDTSQSSMHPRLRCPYGYPGDRLWVRETHARFSVGEGMDRLVPECVAYRATCDEDGSFDHTNGRGEVINLTVTKWTPAIFMPRWASRITLEITDVRAQRLHDITTEDAVAEGVVLGEKQPAIINGELGDVAFFDARTAFAHLWGVINGYESWRANPWVWALTFKRIEASHG